MSPGCDSYPSTPSHGNISHPDLHNLDETSTLPTMFPNTPSRHDEPPLESHDSPLPPHHQALSAINDTYSYHVPSPPRIVVPPPQLHSDASPDITYTGHPAAIPYCYQRTIATLPIDAPYDRAKWKYETRHTAQPILPWLFLGPMSSAKNPTWLRENNISLLLGVRQSLFNIQSRLMLSAQQTAANLGIEHAAIDLPLQTGQLASFSAAEALISAHLSRTWNASAGTQLGRVLVFCESGNERSATVVAAYLMLIHADVDHIKAMQICQAKRVCVNFDDAMKNLLQGFWDLLRAQRTVAGGNGLGDQGLGERVGALKLKRSFQRDEDEDGSGVNGDEQMDNLHRNSSTSSAANIMTTNSSPDDSDDRERFSGRPNFAPFYAAPH